MRSYMKKAGKWMSLCCTVSYKWVNVSLMDCIKLEFNDISLYKKNDSGAGWFVSLDSYIVIIYYSM